mmetsp:Transcript_10432/g.24533  ORF Transcript_10432/g.24533 Transcript_10432/m.24533 type:complete len:248 (+) Transcript_10432:1537-2280(+)
MAPSHASLLPDSICNGVEDLLAVNPEDVLLLRAQRQHASALAENHQLVDSVGLVKETRDCADAHGHVLARCAHIDEEAVTKLRDDRLLGPWQRLQEVCGHLHRHRRALDGSLVVMGVFQQLLCERAVLRVLRKDEQDSCGASNAQVQVLDGHLCSTCGLRLVRNFRVLEELGLSTHKGLVRVGHAGDVGVHDILGDRFRHGLRGGDLLLGSSRRDALCWFTLKVVLAIVSLQALGHAGHRMRRGRGK